VLATVVNGMGLPMQMVSRKASSSTRVSINSAHLINRADLSLPVVFFHLCGKKDHSQSQNGSRGVVTGNDALRLKSLLAASDRRVDILLGPFGHLTKLLLCAGIDNRKGLARAGRHEFVVYEMESVE
jgi:hypothetical protein